jgi:hypothetical protein
MKKIIALAAVATVAVSAPVFAETTQVREVTDEATAPLELKAGQMLYSTAGYRLAPIYRVTESGDPQVIMSGRLITVPVTTVAEADGKIVTSLTKKEVASAR